ncbi:MAG: transporter substrate-binding domain-containing protein [Desulfobacteraceae bacterium]|nr:transporter substrate-binding domain-containing protein [Desulfobacteraceae bacterium]
MNLYPNPKRIVSLLTILFTLLCGIPTYAEPFQIVTEAFPPYIYEEKGEIIGMDVEVLEEAARLAKIEIQITLMPWKRAYSMVETGDADGILTIGYKKERESLFYYPAIPSSMGVVRAFVNTSIKDDIKNLEDLKPLVVGVLSGHMYGEEFDSCEDCLRDQSTGYDMLLKKMEAGRFPVALGNEAVVFYTIKKNALAGIRPVSYVLIEAKYYIASSRASKRGKELNEKISEALLEMQNTGQLEIIWNKFRLSR